MRHMLGWCTFSTTELLADTDCSSQTCRCQRRCTLGIDAFTSQISALCHAAGVDLMFAWCDRPIPDIIRWHQARQGLLLTSRSSSSKKVDTLDSSSAGAPMGIVSFSFFFSRRFFSFFPCSAYTASMGRPASMHAAAPAPQHPSHSTQAGSVLAVSPVQARCVGQWSCWHVWTASHVWGASVDHLQAQGKTLQLLIVVLILGAQQGLQQRDPVWLWQRLLHAQRH